MEKILISACLLGDNTKYDGGNNYFPFVEKLKKKYQLVPFCPEVECGLPTPREPAEIRRGSVVTKSGKDVSALYASSAEKAVNLCKFLGIHIAILKDGSPACGCRYIHDGTFTGIKVEGLGVTARALINAGVKVYAETDGLNFLLPDIEHEKATLRKNIAKQKGKSELKTDTNKKFKDFGEKKSYEDKPRRSYRRPEGVESNEDKNEYGHFEKRKSFGDKKPYGRKPFGERRSYGDRKSSFGEKKTYGEKKSYGERKSYSGKKSYGDKKTYSERKSYGDKKSYGARKSYSGKKSYSSNKSGRSFGRKSYSGNKD